MVSFKIVDFYDLTISSSQLLTDLYEFNINFVTKCLYGVAIWHFKKQTPYIINNLHIKQNKFEIDLKIFGANLVKLLIETTANIKNSF